MDLLRANLSALARVEPALAERMRAVEPAAVEWAPAKTGAWSASIDGLALASKYDPAAEARKLVGEIDYTAAACVALLGLGLGHAAAEVAPKLAFAGLLVIYEPDERLFRAVLEKVDLTPWLGTGHQVVMVGEVDRAALLARVERHAGLVTQGTKLVTHPPTRQRHGEALQKFAEAMTEVLAYCRTNVATALVNSARTCGNSAGNLDRYVAGPTTDALFEAAKGFPAVCVGAGPSLVKNVELLRDPAVRKNVVVIAAQTTLQPLLARGIKPDFVTALDYSEISKRFYEGLTERDVEGVTLVAEPKAHPAILDAFPGAIRCAQSGFCDLLLTQSPESRVPSLESPADPSGLGTRDPGLLRHRRSIPGGATVAHLSFYLARFLGCDPILTIGQDLGFSDGLYYAPGTAIHRVWACELGAFNTIEMMEWQRIVRHRGHLQKRTDIHGQPIYTDEQMLTYLKQFERDFAAAKADGVRVIDCTEGGLPKEHAEQGTLREALEKHATRPVPPLPAAERTLDEGRLRTTADLLTGRVRETEMLKRVCRDAADLLTQMGEHQRDRVRMSELFAKLDKHTGRVQGELKPAFDLVNALNIIGTFRRVKNDRAIAARATADKVDQQAQQIERDLENMKWIAEACDETLEILNAARRRVKSRVPGPKPQVREPEHAIALHDSGPGTRDSGLPA